MRASHVSSTTESRHPGSFIGQRPQLVAQGKLVGLIFQSARMATQA